MVVVAERNTTPDAMMSAYNMVHAMGKTQLGGVRGDWFRDLYHRDAVELPEWSIATHLLDKIFRSRKF
jgi:hypothetical protein